MTDNDVMHVHVQYMFVYMTAIKLCMDHRWPCSLSYLCPEHLLLKHLNANEKGLGALAM